MTCREEATNSEAPLLAEVPEVRTGCGTALATTEGEVGDFTRVGCVVADIDGLGAFSDFGTCTGVDLTAFRSDNTTVARVDIDDVAAGSSPKFRDLGIVSGRHSLIGACVFVRLGFVLLRECVGSGEPLKEEADVSGVVTVVDVLVRTGRGAATLVSGLAVFRAEAITSNADFFQGMTWIAQIVDSVAVFSPMFKTSSVDNHRISVCQSLANVDVIVMAMFARENGSD